MAARCGEAPVGFLNKLIRKGFVTVDGAAGGLRTPLKAGQTVVLRLPEGAWLVAPNRDVSFEIIYEDAHLIVVNKPAGLVSEPGIGHKLDTLLNGLVARYGAELDRLGPAHDFGMVHRLDRDASGLMVVARRPGVQRKLRAAFRKRAVSKAYLLLLAGHLESRGVCDVPLGRRRRGGRLEAVVGGRAARRAVTHYRVVEKLPGTCLVRVRPETGRWHQIRLHFLALGCPVAGDAEHGDPTVNARLRREVGLERLFLHACGLGFDHPETGRKLRFESPLPPELAAVAERLRHT
jgi:23S rRNA pseudouridine1911/1915/1917 synthase